MAAAAAEDKDAIVSSYYRLQGQSVDAHGAENFFQGCSVSPDGLCVLTSTAADGKLRLYNSVLSSSNSNLDNNATVGGSGGDAVVEEWKAALVSSGGDTVRSYDWYPGMDSTDASTCCFLATRRQQPLHLMDAYTGAVRATYRPYNRLDEMESPTVVAFSRDGQRILAAGFQTDRCIHIFDVNAPGRTSTTLKLGKTRRSSDGQKGMVSALASSSSSATSGNNKVFCVGTYAPGSIYVYDDRLGQQSSGTILNGVCVVGHGRGHSRKKRRFTALALPEEGAGDGEDGENWLASAKVKWFQARAQGGVTQVKWDPDRDYILYSASRRSDAILTWDLRMLSGDPEFQSCPLRGVGSFATKSQTNQRLQFDLSSSHLYAGCVDNCVRIYNTKSGDLEGKIDGLDDAANGVSCHRFESSQQSILAVATGSRRFPTETDLEQDSPPQISKNPPGHLRFYQLDTNITNIPNTRNTPF